MRRLVVVRELITRFMDSNVTNHQAKAQNLEVLDPASLPPTDSGLNWAKLLLLGLGAGLLSGLMAALLLALRKRNAVG
jgi:uncharacterized protein involved in exopolysaccharide biosynthesis